MEKGEHAPANGLEPYHEAHGDGGFLPEDVPAAIGDLLGTRSGP